jgi:hypothetical protein
MLILAGPSGDWGHEGPKFHCEQSGRISSVMDDCATSVSTMRSTTSSRPRRNSSTWYGCTEKIPRRSCRQGGGDISPYGSDIPVRRMHADHLGALI